MRNNGGEDARPPRPGIAAVGAGSAPSLRYRGARGSRATARPSKDRTNPRMPAADSRGGGHADPLPTQAPPPARRSAAAASPCAAAPARRARWLRVPSQRLDLGAGRPRPKNASSHWLSTAADRAPSPPGQEWTAAGDGKSGRSAARSGSGPRIRCRQCRGPAARQREVPLREQPQRGVVEPRSQQQPAGGAPDKTLEAEPRDAAALPSSVRHWFAADQ